MLTYTRTYRSSVSGVAAASASGVLIYTRTYRSSVSGVVVASTSVAVTSVASARKALLVFQTRYILIGVQFSKSAMPELNRHFWDSHSFPQEYAAFRVDQMRSTSKNLASRRMDATSEHLWVFRAPHCCPSSSSRYGSDVLRRSVHVGNVKKALNPTQKVHTRWYAAVKEISAICQLRSGVCMSI